MNILYSKLVGKMIITKRLLILIAGSLFFQGAYGAVGLELHTEYERWDSGLDGDASGRLLGAGISTNIFSQWRLGAGLSFGDYSIENNDDAALARKDLDVVLIKKSSTPYSVFFGYRIVSINYENDVEPEKSFDDLSHGLGVGLAAHKRFARNWIPYARVSASVIYSTIDYDQSGSTSGNGLSYGIESGLVYLISAKSNVGFSVKSQANNIDYGGEAGQWDHDYYRIGFNGSYVF